MRTFLFSPQVTVGGRDGVQVGTLEYTIDLIVIIVPFVVGGSMLISVILVAFIVTCMCWCYKRNKMKQKLMPSNCKRELKENER